jgi:hypothetical protein
LDAISTSTTATPQRIRARLRRCDGDVCFGRGATPGACGQGVLAGVTGRQFDGLDRRNESAGQCTTS